MVPRSREDNSLSIVYIILKRRCLRTATVEGQFLRATRYNWDDWCAKHTQWGTDLSMTLREERCDLSFATKGCLD
jgi:hypothetical protein